MSATAMDYIVLLVMALAVPYVIAMLAPYVIDAVLTLLG
jgi:hypothetical protein